MNVLRQSILYLLLINVFPVPSDAQAAAPASANQLLQAAVADGACIGIAAGIAIEDSIAWQTGAGNSAQGVPSPFSPETITRLASIAKPMTAVAILQLHEAGKLDLDTPVQTYLPDFPHPPTVRQLLDHSSGIGEYASKREQRNERHYPDLTAALGIFQDRPLVFSPGTQFGYTSYGYVVLGRIIEVVSGQSYEEYMRTNIWELAGMTATSVERTDHNYTGKAQMYHRSNNGRIKPIPPTDLSDRVPGGGIQSTVTDVLRFGMALLANKLISPESRQLMWTDSGLKKEGNPYGLGWYLYGDNPAHGPVYGHNGAQLGCSAFLFILPQEQRVIVVLSNTSGAMQRVSNIAASLI